MTIWVHTNGRPSNGAKALSEQPGFKRCRTGKFVKPTDTVINWGSSQPFPHHMPNVKNFPIFVRDAANKLRTFEVLSAGKVPTVEWTKEKKIAQAWSLEGCVVFARTSLTGHSGHGIIIVDKHEPVPDAPLYTKYVFKDREFRVHVINGKVIDTVKKIRDPSKEVTNWKVRSHDNGFIFARNGLEPDPKRDQLAIDTIDTLQLHFGAVDIIQDKAGKYYVLEVNTAPGFDGDTTVGCYAGAFRGQG